MAEVVYRGESIQSFALADGLVELRFDRVGEAINKFDAHTVEELRAATKAIAAHPGLRGILISSGKDVFIVGADIGEFGAMFAQDEAAIARHTRIQNTAFTDLEDLDAPIVIAINGFALGGGLEMALCGDFRVMSSTAQVGLPEVKLGLFPGFGGTVRISRVAGSATAIEWITQGRQYTAEKAMAAQVVDEVASPETLRDAALAVLREAADGKRDWRSRRAARLGPLPAAEADPALFAAARGKVAQAAAKHQPAAVAAVDLLAAAATKHRDDALTLEANAFARIARTQAASSLVQNFWNDQAVRKISKRLTRDLPPIKQAAVLGAGIMGGGIAATSAVRGLPVRMKDIAQGQLDLGMREAGKLVGRQVASGRLKQDKADRILQSIMPQLDYAHFGEVDIVIEAVVENLDVKRRVLAEVERELGADAVIASNTSSLRIDDMDGALQRPQNFVGMHFFNPVPVMPLVEIIRGSRTSDRAVSVAVAQAVAMGKTPIVVRDCPGFLVNRIITPYTMAFFQLIAEGADFAAIDRAAEDFGWPMGPAYLQDVVGLDTASHVGKVIAAGYGERLGATWENASELLASHGRYGQKNGIGFYRYEANADGKPRKIPADDTHALLAAIQPNGRREFSAEEINERLMLALVIEAARSLEEGVVASPAELDMALLLGIGFPQYLGGALKYADWLGLDRIVAQSDKYGALAPIYQATPAMRAMAANAARYHGSADADTHAVAKPARKIIASDDTARRTPA